jgi:ATP/maltotriose-dependent transcriptional regulator MalT
VVDVSRATGQGAVLLVTMTAQAWSLIQQGRLEEAHELLTGAIEAGYLAPNLFLSVAVGLSSVVATCQGRYHAALRAGEESVRLAGSADPGLIAGMSGLYYAIPLIETGRARRAREVLLAMSGGGPELQTSRSGYAAAYEVLARAELALRDLPAAEEWARRGEAAVANSDLPGEVAVARRATAAVALARGHTRRAVDVALDAAALADQGGAPIEAGRCRIVGARSLAASGDQARAVVELERVVKDLGRVGAEGYRAEAARELRGLGRRVRRGTASSAAVDDALQGLAEPVRWGTLTRSERAVVALVAEGLSNPEVAERLYVSPHTVKRHLANATAKLGVTSRRELRGLIERNS